MMAFVTYVVSKSAHVQVGVFECVSLCRVVVAQDFLDSLEVGILDGLMPIHKWQDANGGCWKEKE